jgi:hypothetical protein
MTGVVVARPINGITINGLEYLLDDDGKSIVFAGQREAEAFLLSCGISEDELRNMHFIEEEQHEIH